MNKPEPTYGSGLFYVSFSFVFKNRSRANLNHVVENVEVHIHLIHR